MVRPAVPAEVAVAGAAAGAGMGAAGGAVVGVALAGPRQLVVVLAGVGGVGSGPRGAYSGVLVGNPVPAVRQFSQAGAGARRNRHTEVGRAAARGPQVVVGALPHHLE